MQEVQGIYPFLEQAKKIVITTHQKPDGDAMGSSLALFHFLRSIGHEVTVISPTNWAAFLNWMPGCSEVIDFEKKPEIAKLLIEKTDIIFCLDFNIMHRTKSMELPLLDANCIKVLIDHHQQPQEEAFNFGVSDVAKSSTCEMVYDFIVGSKYSGKLNLDIAACIYTGIMTDTGSFRFPSTTAAVHRAVAHLKDLGLKHSVIHDNIYDNLSESRLRFLGNALLNRLEVLYEYNTALMVIPKRDLLKFEIKTGDTEGLVNYLLTIQGIKLGALLIDRDEERKWSFRSKGDFDVNIFARQHFEGGGHKNAAGGRSSDSIDDNVKKFEIVLKQYENQLQ
ncbi:MAG TPA: bifunctional oligoribonuclease/PAP phosphatase NrnA [Chitinophagaceae bacterium]|nr:bifunctional oligoribonuclease/PAP phosphatase NrnA [Chitinophagaceae bacterium]